MPSSLTYLLEGLRRPTRVRILLIFLGGDRKARGYSRDFPVVAFPDFRDDEFRELFRDLLKGFISHGTLGPGAQLGVYVAFAENPGFQSLHIFPRAVRIVTLRKGRGQVIALPC